jgi:hypothetical protein
VPSSSLSLLWEALVPTSPPSHSATLAQVGERPLLPTHWVTLTFGTLTEWEEERTTLP